MDKKKQEQLENYQHGQLKQQWEQKGKQEQMIQQHNHNEFNSVTQKVKPENQNQEHNVRKEGLQPINQKR